MSTTQNSLVQDNNINLITLSDLGSSIPVDIDFDKQLIDIYTQNYSLFLNNDINLTKKNEKTNEFEKYFQNKWSTIHKDKWEAKAISLNIRNKKNMGLLNEMELSFIDE